MHYQKPSDIASVFSISVKSCHVETCHQPITVCHDFQFYLIFSKSARLNGNLLFNFPKDLFSEIFRADKYLARYAQKRILDITRLLLSDFNQSWNGRQIVKLSNTKSQDNPFRVS